MVSSFQGCRGGPQSSSVSHLPIWRPAWVSPLPRPESRAVTTQSPCTPSRPLAGSGKPCSSWPAWRGLLGLLNVVVRRLRPDEASPDSVWFGKPGWSDGLMFPLAGLGRRPGVIEGLHKADAGPLVLDLGAGVHVTGHHLHDGAHPASGLPALPQLTCVIERAVSWLAWGRRHPSGSWASCPWWDRVGQYP